LFGMIIKNEFEKYLLYIYSESNYIYKDSRTAIKI
jgi:hypothetical protein